MGGLRSLKPFVKIYTILVTVFFVSMILVYCIPTLWIQKNVEASLEVMEGEGERPSYAFYRHTAIVDNHTDMLMYESLIPSDPQYNLVQSSVSVNHYPRYWHGYQVILRPLPVFFQVQELRYLGMLVFYLLFFWSAWLIAKRTKPIYGMFYVLTIASSYLGVVATCFQYLTSFYVLFVALIVLFSGEHEKKLSWLFLFFFTVGMVENFFDFLTYPIITLGIPLILLLWMRVRDQQADFLDNFRFMCLSSVSWGLGYGLTWIMKWVLASVILGFRYFWRTIGIARYRMMGNEEEPLDRIGTIRRNLKAWMNVQDDGIITWSKVVLVFVIIMLILMIWRKLRDTRTICACLPILIVAAYPYVWYLVMSNHSQIHFWYTYRAQLVAMLGILVFCESVLREKTKDEAVWKFRQRETGERST